MNSSLSTLLFSSTTFNFRALANTWLDSQGCGVWLWLGAVITVCNRAWFNLSRWSWWILEELTSLMEITSWRWGCCGALSCTGRWEAAVRSLPFQESCTLFCCDSRKPSQALGGRKYCFYFGLVNKGRPVFGFCLKSIGCLPWSVFSYVPGCAQPLSLVPAGVNCREAFRAEALYFFSFLKGLRQVVFYCLGSWVCILQLLCRFVSLRLNCSWFIQVSQKIIKLTWRDFGRCV